MNISPADWLRLSPLLDEALELDHVDREAWLARLAPGDRALSGTLRSLLDQHAAIESRDILETPPDFAAALLAESRRDFSAHELAPNSMIGPYRLLRELGAGGMGAVWLAERVDGKLNRQVALKFPYAGPFQRQLAERIRRERDILASLEHPNIARLYDADVTSSGSPFLVLEYVDGLAIDQYCERRELSIRERLKLFLQVLKAVQYAHAHLVIHRDIKPSNILITPDGVAHLLDFGVAKLTLEGVAKATALTNFSGRALTPEYSSPEQITCGAVTTASDVYSLGVVLYELLVGAPPYRLKRDSRAALEDAIAEADAVVPSRAVKAIDHSAANRRSAQLRGDLDAILLRALRKDTAARYATADAFREDIERYLDGRVVVAQNANLVHRVGRFLRRNRLATGAVTAVILALASGLGIALWQAQEARKQALAARSVQQFMENIFRSNSSEQPDPVRARQTTARELLDVGAKNIRTSLDAVPESKLEALKTLADMYRDLHLEDQAVALHRERVELAEKTFGDNSPEAAEALVYLAEVMETSNNGNDIKGVLSRATRILDLDGDRSSLLRAKLLVATSVSLQSTDRARSMRLGDEALVILRKYPPDDSFVTSLYSAALAHAKVGENDVAAADLEEAIATARKIGFEDKSQLVLYSTYLGESYVELTRYADAEASFRNGARIASELDSGSGVDSAQVAMRFGIFLCGISRFGEGLKLLAEASDKIVKARGMDDSFHTPTILAAYGHELDRFGEPEEGLKFLEPAIANRRRNRPNTYPLTQMLENRARISIEFGDTAEAQKDLEAARAIHVLNKDSEFLQFHYQETMVDWLIATNRAAEARRVAGELAAESSRDPNAYPDWYDAMLVQTRASLADGDATEAAALAAQIHGRLAVRSLLSWRKSVDAQAALLRSEAEMALRHPEIAKPLAEHALAVITEIYSPSSPLRARAMAVLGQVELSVGDRRSAKALVDQATAIEAAHPRLGEQYRGPLHELSIEVGQSTS